MTGLELHRYQLLGLVNTHPKGIRNKTIYEKTGMTPYQLTMAGKAEALRISKYYSRGLCGYRRAKEAPPIQGMPTRREVVPMHLLPAYTGETKRAGAVI